jgi:hypothetical protein
MHLFKSLFSSISINKKLNDVTFKILVTAELNNKLLQHFSFHLQQTVLMTTVRDDLQENSLNV